MNYETACNFELYTPGSEPGWIVHSRNETVYSHPHLLVDKVRASPPSRGEHGSPVSWIVARRKPAVVMAPMTPEGKLLLVRQERVPVETTLWEFPAGQVEETGDERTTLAIVETALRELEEETGHRPDPATGEVIPLGYFFTSQGFTDEHLYPFFLRNVVITGEGTHYDEGECIVECRAFAPEEIRRMIASNAIADGITLGLCARLWSRGLLG